MFTLQDVINTICKQLRIVCPKTIKKFSYPQLASYDASKKVLILQKDTDTYELRYAVAVALRLAFQQINGYHMDEYATLLDSHGYAYYFFDHYMDTAIEYDQFDEKTIEDIKSYAQNFYRA